MPRKLQSAAISFGLVTIPADLYTATSSESISFNQIHGECGSRIKQQLFCPVCNRVVERSELVKGYEISKGQYVQLTVALAKMVMRGKENLVLVRAAKDLLLLHFMYYADEVRDTAEIPKGTFNPIFIAMNTENA